MAAQHLAATAARPVGAAASPVGVAASPVGAAADPWRPRWADARAVPEGVGLRPGAAARGAVSRSAGPTPAHRLALEPFEDARYPWSAIGRVDVEGGWASGALVGPRHLLTASHVVVWEGESAGWMRFTPGAFEDRAPYGQADVVAVHYGVAVVPPSIDAHEERYDFAVCVLDRPVGEQSGWLGVRSYEDHWDGLRLWNLVGYRGESAHTAQPVHVGGLWLGGHEDHGDESQVIFHAADATSGLSGGPVLGQWAQDALPSVVAVQSWANPFQAGACGGHRLVELVRDARIRYP